MIWLSKKQAKSLGLEPTRKSRQMNRWEREHADELELMRRNGAILYWGYEVVRFRLAEGAWFKPDFLVIYPGGICYIHEVKGFMREAAALRLKVLAEQIPLPVLLWRKVAGRWESKRIGGHE